MKTKNELNTDILNITMKIKDKFPELSKYLAEMPITIPTDKNPKINIETLSSYYNSLDSMLSKYELELNQKRELKRILLV